MVKVEWKDTPDHPWNYYAVLTQSDITPSLDDDLHATMMFMLRRVNLSDLIDRVIESVSTGSEHLSDPNIINSFAFVIAVLHLSPLKIKLVMNDEQADLFSNLVKRDGDMYFLEKSIVEKHSELKPLIQKFIEDNILIEGEGKYFITVTMLGDIQVSF